ncbi:hypothetical protein [Clostridium sp. DJ247]|uniref:hypothetical protein n=1 Tax=Clostridium sp. DJ247 TaxID=2726188 RepID=UPI001628DB54|nr:hypothetical protein [Clostridium sp. DJ247]MBC2580580.1 hypothetical protein [Clostridium sp. DJ247]
MPSRGYSILASIIPNTDNKEQKNVDRFIREELKKQGIAIEERDSTKWSFKTTVLIWLRNEVGHTTKEPVSKLMQALVKM